MKLGLCVIGCGGFARTFAEQVVVARDRVDLFFASRDYARAKDYCNEFNGAGAFGSYEDAAADSRVEAVYICTPHHLHVEHAQLAARAKKHVLLEKPIARTVDEAQAIISAADAAGVKLMIAENYRFRAPVQEAKRIIDSGVLGRVRLIQVQQEHPFDPISWRNNRYITGGGIWIDGGIHKASVLAYLAGRPTQVYAVEVPTGVPGLEAEDGIVVTTRSPSGVVGIINFTWAVGKPAEVTWVSISGTLANLYFELHDQGPHSLRIEYSGSQEVRQLGYDQRGLAPMVLEFRRSIMEASEPAMTGEEGLRDLDLVLKAYESARTGLPVAVGQAAG